MNDQQLGMSRIKVVHALQAIVKPTAKSNEAAQKYVQQLLLNLPGTILINLLVPAGRSRRR